jgi:hypothetical protein
MAARVPQERRIRVSFTDKLPWNKNGKKKTLPRGAKLVRRERRSGGSDVGYYDGDSFTPIDDSTSYGNNYVDSGSPLSPSDALDQLADSGYDTSSYGASSGSDDATSSYGGGASADFGSSGSSYGSDTGSSSYSSYDSGSSSCSPSDSSSSSSYDSGSSS